jgi:hypothetical protein
MPDNRAVTYMGPGKVQVETIDYPTLELRASPCDCHSVCGRPESVPVFCVQTPSFWCCRPTVPSIAAVESTVARVS